MNCFLQRIKLRAYQIKWGDDNSFKIFRCFRVAPIPRLILHNRLALTIFWRCEQYTIDSMVYLIGTRSIDGTFAWKRGFLSNSELKQMAFTTSRRRNSCIFTKTEPYYGGNARIRKTYCSMVVIYFLSSICKKKHLFISWNRAEKKAKVEKKVFEEVTLLSTKKYFVVSCHFYSTIAGFGFLIMWRIMQISEDGIHLGLQPRCITSSSICLIFLIILSFIQ